MAPIMEGVFGVALLVNLEAYQNNETIPYVWTSVSYGSFVWYATLGLLIAILGIKIVIIKLQNLELCLFCLILVNQ